MLQHTQAGQVNITLPQDLSGKTVLLVMGGYLHTVGDEMIQRIAENTFRVDFLKLPLLERYYESKQYLDLSELNLSSTPLNEHQIINAELLTTRVLDAYLTLSQSFAVILDCEEVYTQKKFIKRTGFPDMYIAYDEPVYPLVTNLGRHPEYWSTHEDEQYSVTIYDSVIDNKLFNTTQTELLKSVDASRRSTRPGNISPAYFLEIGRDI
jgi:hypothetical protein